MRTKQKKLVEAFTKLGEPYNFTKRLKAVKETTWALRRFYAENDKEVVLEAVKQNRYALQYASKKLRKDKEILLEVKSLKKKEQEIKNSKREKIFEKEMEND